MNHRAICCVVILFVEPIHCRKARKSEVVAEGGYRRGSSLCHFSIPPPPPLHS